MPQTLKKKMYLIVGAKKGSHSSRISELTHPRIVSDRGIPATKGNEIAIKLTVELPASLFVNPTYSATISVGEGVVSQPTIEAAVINNIEEVVAEATGLTLKIESGNQAQ